MNKEKNEKFKKIFQDSLRLNARSMSIKTLLSERNLKRIKYDPYYQRNYVWDITKQSFFIESVILGTEIPPLILFKTGPTIEVIDGRQRFETLKRFKENDIKLSIKGLMQLQKLDKQSFNLLSPENKDVFLDSNIRIFEFEIINQPDLTEDVVDRVKKEIFQRYNTGITPLNREELDNAKYDDDDFSDLFKDKLKKDKSFHNQFNTCFFPKENTDKGDLITKDLDFIRKYRILNEFPIAKYAAGSRTEIRDLLYDFAKNNSDDVEKEYDDFIEMLFVVFNINNDLRTYANLNNKLIYECILWAISILKKENVDFVYDKKLFYDHYVKNHSKYSEDSSHYYGEIIKRYTDTAEFFQRQFEVDMLAYIRNDNFNNKLAEIRQTEFTAAKSIEKLSNLRSNKPNPISTPIDDLRNDLKTNKYLLRPTYQRQEKINILKASSIIESILLGIKLPPIFIYKKKDRISEVVDGQQRLLSIIGFLSEQYIDETGELSYSKNNNFKLKGLKILKDLEKHNYSQLTDEYRDRILDFDLDLVIIEQSLNENFDPIDLFIRLNYKPYPIKPNSFEFWNSIVQQDIIREVKRITADPMINSWFFLRELSEGTPDRMLNEELIMILSFITYVYDYEVERSDDILGFFLRQDRITCRLKNKKSISDFLLNDLEINSAKKKSFISSIEKVEQKILVLKLLFPDDNLKEAFNNLLNVKGTKNFRRSLQDFYVIWLILMKLDSSDFETKSSEIYNAIKNQLKLLKNASKEKVDNDYMEKFHSELAKSI